MHLRISTKFRFEELASYGSRHSLWLDKFCALMLALSPLLQHYKGIYDNAGFTVLLLIAPFIALRLVLNVVYGRISKTNLLAIIPLMLFQVYKSFSHDVTISKLIYGLFCLFFFMAIASGCVNARYFVKYVAMVASAASVCLIIQYITYYLLGFHLQLVPTSLLLEESSQWIAGAKTGLVGITGKSNGFYRPSAFFLEPSHMFLYSFTVLALLLLLPNMKRWRLNAAVLVTMGIILSTSGMGVAVSVGLWGIYMVLYYNAKNKKNVARLRNLLSAKTLWIAVGAIVLLVILYFTMDVFRNTINRIFFSGSDGNSSAIDGRIRLARMLVQSQSGSTILFGVTDDVSDITFNLSGFFATLYKYGILGLILSYLFYGQGLFRLKGAYFWISFVIVFVSIFSAHTHGTFYMIYYVIVLMDGYRKAGIEATLRKKQKKLIKAV